MTGQVHWLPLAVLLATVLSMLYVFVRAKRQELKYAVEAAHVRCRDRGNQLAACTVVRDAKTGVAIGIRECSAHAGKEGGHCEKTCLPLFARAS